MAACSICRHPRHDEINVSLIRIGTRPTARQFALSLPALDRHKKHLPKQLATDPAVESACEPSTLLERIERLMKESETIAEAAKREKDWAAATSALREARTCIELLARIRGELQSGTQVRVGVAVQAQPSIEQRTDQELEVAIALQVREATGNFDIAEIEKLRVLAGTAERTFLTDGTV